MSVDQGTRVCVVRRVSGEWSSQECTPAFLMVLFMIGWGKGKEEEGTRSGEKEAGEENEEKQRLEDREKKVSGGLNARDKVYASKEFGEDITDPTK